MDLQNNNFIIALEKFKNNVLNLDLKEEDFYKYNSFVNVVMLMEKNDKNIFISYNQNTLRNGPCAEAIASYTLATIGLSACWMTGPGAPLFCGAAIAAKVLAYRAMLRDCAQSPNQNQQ